jgi:hypothetical protein
MVVVVVVVVMVVVVLSALKSNHPSFTPFCFNGPYQVAPLLNLQPLIFDLCLFDLRPLFLEHS